MSAVLATLDPANYAPHRLHDLARTWPETNCYADLWIEVLASFGLDPIAGLGFTVRQDWEGDQFTFFKHPPEDLDLLYGIEVQELSIYDSLVAHVAEQVGNCRLTLVEVDGYHLPDTAGTSYGIEHTKTTIAINRIDRARERIEYFHNAGYFAAERQDFRALFRLDGDMSPNAALFPYVEFVKVRRGRGHGTLRDTAVERLRHHLQRRPRSNPFLAFKALLPRAIEQLIAGTDFQKYAFNTARQFGANFELLAEHLAWLEAKGAAELGAETAA
ncbi:MAG: DUF1839 family protein, partial [Proteobacteria bacterium]|nr:DUF1839 family protein [Pseudomonadota bacterium]